MPQEILTNNFWVSDINGDDFETTDYIAFKVEKHNFLLSFENRIDFINNIPEVISKNDLDPRKILEPYKIKSNPKIKIRVNEVGQGNFNEIHIDNNLLVWYDLGSRTSDTIKKVVEIRSKAIEINFKISELIDEIKVESFGLIISHWDVDHYNGIFNLTNEQLEKFDFIVLPKTIPNQTSLRAFNLLPPQKVLLVNSKPKIRNQPKKMHVVFDLKYIKLFRATKSSNRNKSGIVVSCHGEEKDAILSGDQKYELINAVVVPKCKNKNMILVVPHHGGHSGDVKLVANWNVIAGIISVGDNPWGHPYENVINEFNGKLLCRTNEPKFQFEWSL
jgi:beta-lactamase superfamily II metal-dependent hydrolase